MAERTNIYIDDLIDAIDDWQAGSRKKARKAERLIEASKHFPASYREASPEVFRQVRGKA
ncbi:hypothetical protein [Hyphomicrobium sp.]|uniref:hypothetical protein n=1 Tax=Hyphomicrobium sp. TaxID=82 RepID=UPI001D3B4029|nr:hypothetical protein [Hyphomicrobium sp.]MBY0562432.1 hypothetical protein [Hyphomicrobium sp.]